MTQRNLYLLILCLLASNLIFGQPKLIPFLQKDHWGYVDKKMNLKIEAIYEEAEPFIDGLAIVQREGKKGFINEKGVEVIACQYAYVYPFSDGLAKVTNKELMSGYIDKTGNLVISMHYRNAGSFKNGRTSVGESYATAVVIDLTGKVLSNPYKSIGEYQNGLAPFQTSTSKGVFWGYLGMDGSVAIPAEYDEVGSFSVEGLAAVQKDFKVGFINKYGNLVIGLQFDNPWMPRFTEGLCAVQLGPRWGIIDAKGNWVVKPKFDYIGEFSEGLACAYQEAKFGFIDKSGNWVIPCQYEASIAGDYSFVFKEGLAGVFSPQNKGLGFLDKKGKVVIPFDFPYLGQRVDFDASGLALVPIPNNYLQMAYIDKKGNRYWTGVADLEKSEEEDKD